MKYQLLAILMICCGCAFDPICEPSDEVCEFAEEFEEMNSSDPDLGDPEDAMTQPDVSEQEPEMNVPRPDVPPGVCPAVETCGDEPDHIRKSVVWTEEYGCGARGFQSRTVSILDGLCGGDTDWHGFRYRPCETRSFVVEAVVQPAVPACLDLMELNIANDDGFRLCGAEGARCERQPDGTLRASLLVQAIDFGGTSETYYFVLDSTSETDAPYTITVSAFQ